MFRILILLIANQSKTELKGVINFYKPKTTMSSVKRLVFAALPENKKPRCAEASSYKCTASFSPC